MAVGGLDFSATLDISSTLKVLEKLKQFNLVNIGVRSIMEDALARIKRGTPGSGTIRGLWEITESLSVRGFIAKIMIRNRYRFPEVIEYLERGTRPHEIRPRYARALKFDIGGAQPIFAMLVYHPGTKAYKMVTLAHIWLDFQIQTFANKIAEHLAKEANL